MSDVDLDCVRLAIAAAGAVNDQRAWSLRVAELTPVIAAMLRPPAQGQEDVATTPTVTAAKMREASVFTAEFVKFSDEEMDNTHRLLVAFRSKTSDAKEQDGDGLEWLRTEPSWTAAGYVLQRKVRDLEPGQQCTVFKSIESIPGNKKVRVLIHMDARPKSRTSQSEPRQDAPPVERARSGGEAAGAEPAPAPAATPEPTGAVAERFDKLNSRQRVAFGRYCSGQGWTDFMNPGPDTIDKVLVTLTKIENGEVLTS